MKTDQERIKEYMDALLDIAEILDVKSEIGPQHIVNAVHDLRAQLSAFEILKAEHAELLACNKTGAERLQFVLRENARLRDSLNEWVNLTDAGLRLRCGELTAQEIRTVRAVLRAVDNSHGNTQS
jgi:hypothetical protein